MPEAAMKELTDLTRRPGVWNVDVQLLVLYAAAAVLLYVIHAAARRASSALPGAREGKAPAALAGLVLSAAGQAAGAVAVVAVSRRMGRVPPLLVLGVPLFLTVESSVRRMMSDKAAARLHAACAAGAAAGLLAAAYALMRGSPLK